jgi:hypothetical protein
LSFRLSIRAGRGAAFRLVAAALLAAWGSSAGPAAAQDDVPVEENAQPQAEQQQFLVADETFDQWVFGQRGGNATASKSRLESALLVQIENLDRLCSLTEEQRTKLRLAGRGDIKRLFDRLEQMRKKFQLVKTDQNKINEFFQEVQPLQAVLSRGPFGPGSIFSKTVKSSLTPEQAEQAERAQHDRRLFEYKARVELVVNMLDERLALRAAERKQLVELLVNQTRPPESRGNRQYDYYVILFQVSKIPPAKLQAILDEPQYKALQKAFDQMRGMEAFLRNNGVLQDE